MFYQKAALQAKAAGIAVNVLTVEGEDCSMEMIGLLADLSGGQVDIVNPVKEHIPCLIVVLQRY